MKHSLTLEKTGMSLESCFAIDEDGNSQTLMADVGGLAEMQARRMGGKYACTVFQSK